MTEKIKSRLPVVICDPGCRDKRGHHYEFNNFLETIMEVSDCYTNIHSTIDEYHKIFYHSPYSIVPEKHKQIYRGQIEEDAKTIAALSNSTLCLIHSVSRDFIVELSRQEQIRPENIVLLFPAADALNFLPGSNFQNIVVDKWYEPISKDEFKFCFFPRNEIWFQSRNFTLNKGTAILPGTRRKEKCVEAFLDFCERNCLAPVFTEQALDIADYVRQISQAEYVWCGFAEAFKYKPSNTVYDAAVLKKNIIISKNTKPQVENLNIYDIKNTDYGYYICTVNRDAPKVDFSNDYFISTLKKFAMF